MEASILDYGIPKGMKLPLKTFIKTIQGISMLQTGEVFCLDSQLYQGFNGTGCALAFEDVMSEAELAAIKDVDGTLKDVMAARELRLSGRQFARNKEIKERKLSKDQQSLVGLQVEREALALEEQRLKTESARLENERMQRDPLDLDVDVYSCDKCDATFPTQKGLTGHKVGKHSG